MAAIKYAKSMRTPTDKNAGPQQILIRATFENLPPNGVVSSSISEAIECAFAGRKLVRQINTHGICHLDAEMIGKHLEDWEGAELGGLDYLFIENVGNLVCPSSYDLGEKIRVALLSVTEGEDKPLKYPTMFNSADAAVITKMDIAEPCGFDRELALKNINEIRPGIRIFETSAKTGAGMEEWLGYLEEQRAPRA